MNESAHLWMLTDEHCQVFTHLPKYFVLSLVARSEPIIVGESLQRKTEAKNLNASPRQSGYLSTGVRHIHVLENLACIFRSQAWELQREC
jgi:hypothetical protein